MAGPGIRIFVVFRFDKEDTRAEMGTDFTRAER